MSGLAPIVLIIFGSEVVLMSHSTTKRDDLFCLPFIQYFSCLCPSFRIRQLKVQ